MSMTLRSWALAAGFVLLAIIPLIADAIGEPYYLTLFSRIMVFAIAALSLDLILGYGGMVSFGHAAYIGLGAYAVGILAHYEIYDGFLQLIAAVIGSALVAAFIGWFSLRTSGMYFIMITLAFTQMLFFLGVSLEEFGGDDGMNIRRSRFFGAPILNNDMTLYYVILVTMALCTYVGWRLINSRFGMVVRGAMSNENRMQAIGFPTMRYRLAAFMIAGVMCGLAGYLLANITKFVTPEFMNWLRSGEILVMVLMGGMGTLFGPLFGAAVFLLLEEILSGFTSNWQIIMGPFLVVLVLFAKRGLWSLLPEKNTHG